MGISIAYNKIRQSAPTILLFVLLSVVTTVQTGDFRVRLASTSVDYNPVTYSYYFQNPEHFKGDIISTYASSFVFATMQNWLPALLLKTFNISPVFSAWVFFILQNVLLGLAVFRFTRLATGKNDIAWLAVFFAFSAEPLKWNLANYGSPHYPLALYLAMPILIFAAAELTQGRIFLVGILLLLSALIHPAITINFELIVGIFFLVQYLLAGERRNFLTGMIILTGVAIICALPGFLLQVRGPDRLTASEFMEGARYVIHFFPWNFQPRWSVMVPSFIGFMALTGLSFRHWKDVQHPYLKLLISSVAGTAILILIHLGGAFLEIPIILKLMGIRASMLLVMVSLPLVMVYLSEKLNNDQIAPRFISACILLLTAYSGYGFYPALILGIFLTDLAGGRLFWLEFNANSSILRWQNRAGLLIAVGWCVITVLILKKSGYSLTTLERGNILSWKIFGIVILAATLTASIRSVLHAFGSGHNSVARYFAVIGLALVFIAFGVDIFRIGTDPEFGRLQYLFLAFGLSALLVSIVTYRFGIERIFSLSFRKSLNTASQHFFSQPMLIMIAILIGLTAVTAWKSGQETASGAWLASKYEAQLWIRNNTMEKAVIIDFEGSGRTISLRRLVAPLSTTMYRYSNSRPTKRFDDEYLSFYGLKDTFRKGVVPIHSFFDLEKAAYLSLDEDGILHMARRFGGDYIVRRKDEPLNFQNVYTNKHISIYKIPNYEWREDISDTGDKDESRYIMRRDGHKA